MLSVNVPSCVCPPPTARIVIVYELAVAVDDAAKVSVLVNVGVPMLGVNWQVTPVGGLRQ